MDEVTVNGLDSKYCEHKANVVHHSEINENILLTNFDKVHDWPTLPNASS